MMTDDSANNLNASREVAARSFNGYVMLFVLLGSMLWFGWAMSSVIPDEPNADFLGMGLSIVVSLFVSSGFYMLQPNQGVALTLFGAYKGTDRNEGLRWTWPWIAKAARNNSVFSVWALGKSTKKGCAEFRLRSTVLV